jgi:tellurite resistance protein
LAGFAIALQKAAILFPVAPICGAILLVVAAGLFVLLLALYVTKSVRYWSAVRAEFLHPVKLAFFPTITISLLLFSIGLVEFRPVISAVLWYIGAAGHIMFTLVIMSVWMRGAQFKVEHFNPAWFIPAVGSVVVPIAGVAHAPVEISWFFFSVGLLLWVSLLTIFLYRVTFHHPLPEKLMPTLFILVAPPAVAMISLVKLMGEVTVLAIMLYSLALFFLLLVVLQIDRLAKLTFYLSWWAYSFPLAAFTIATYVLAEDSGHWLMLIWLKLLLVFLFLVIAGLIMLTWHAVRERRICVAEE